MGLLWQLVPLEALWCTILDHNSRFKIIGPSTCVKKVFKYEQRERLGRFTSSFTKIFVKTTKLCSTDHRHRCPPPSPAFARPTHKIGCCTLTRDFPLQEQLSFVTRLFVDIVFLLLERVEVLPLKFSLYKKCAGIRNMPLKVIHVFRKVIHNFGAAAHNFLSAHWNTQRRGTKFCEEPWPVYQ